MDLGHKTEWRGGGARCRAAAKGGAFSFGKSKARMLDGTTTPSPSPTSPGCDEAGRRLEEVVDFPEGPAEVPAASAGIPAACCWSAPGTGKTLLAKSIAGEGKVPFFTISAGLRRDVRRRWARRACATCSRREEERPCIIFIDEIDAVGRQRGAGLGGGNDEREQTLNQMLVEMDGFETNLGVIVIAATNRPDILDAALLRPAASTARSTRRCPTSAAASRSRTCTCARSRSARTSARPSSRAARPA